MEPLNLQIYLFTFLRQQRRELVDDSPRGQSIVGRCVVDLPSLPLDLVEFLLKHPLLISESLSIDRATSIELGVVPSGGSAIPGFLV
jgi:hypothetical protein